MSGYESPQLYLGVLKDHTAEGKWDDLCAGETLVFGDLVYFKAADSRVWKAQADAATTMPAIGICTTGGTAGQYVRVVFWGAVRDDSWAFTIKGLVYVSAATAGLVTQTLPSTSGHQVQCIGWAVTADIIFLIPNFAMGELL
jgi:hypothetical protein